MSTTLYYRFIEILKRGEGYNPYRDDHGRFASGDGGGGGGGGKVGGKHTPTKAPSKAEIASAQRNIKAGKGTPGDRLTLDHASAADIDPFYTRDPKDGGGIHSLKWDAKAQPAPKGYPKEWPKAPRDMSKAVKYNDFTKTFPLPKGITMEKINDLHNQGEHGKHLAKVLMNELYAFGRARQGNSADSYSYTKGSTQLKNDLIARGLSSISGYQWHHMLMQNDGGSNSGKNLVLFDRAEHAMAHQLEASIKQVEGKKGIISGNLGLPKSFANMNAEGTWEATNKQLPAAFGAIRQAYHANPKGPKREAAVAAKIATYKDYLTLAYSLGAIKTPAKNLADVERFIGPKGNKSRDWLHANAKETFVKNAEKKPLVPFDKRLQKTLADAKALAAKLNKRKK